MRARPLALACLLGAVGCAPLVFVDDNPMLDWDGDGFLAPEHGGDDCDDEDPTVHAARVVDDFNAGDLSITELMIDPPDGEPEWIEVRNEANTCLDLTGLLVTDIQGPVGDELEVFDQLDWFRHVRPGEHAVIASWNPWSVEEAREAEYALYLLDDIGYWLANAGTRVYLVAPAASDEGAEPTTIAQLHYLQDSDGDGADEERFPVTDGSTMEACETTLRSEPYWNGSAWCEGERVMDNSEGGRGSPGRANDCRAEGERLYDNVEVLDEGELVLTEIAPDDRWVELYNASRYEVDLYGLVVWGPAEGEVDAVDNSYRLPPGEAVVLGTDGSELGGLDISSLRLLAEPTDEDQRDAVWLSNNSATLGGAAWSFVEPVGDELSLVFDCADDGPIDTSACLELEAWLAGDCEDDPSSCWHCQVEPTPGTVGCGD